MLALFVKAAVLAFESSNAHKRGKSDLACRLNCLLLFCVITFKMLVNKMCLKYQRSYWRFWYILLLWASDRLNILTTSCTSFIFGLTSASIDSSEPVTSPRPPSHPPQGSKSPGLLFHLPVPFSSCCCLRAVQVTHAIAPLSRKEFSPARSS